jgi:hypothetical protein
VYVGQGLSSFYTSPKDNGISDHDAQFLTEVNLIPFKEGTRKINNQTIVQFQHLLENKLWEPVFRNKDTNYKFKLVLLFRMKL